MSAAHDLSRDEPAGPADQALPQVFSRVFAVPSGAPWEQARAAQLEVRHGSPLPIAELIWRLRRLDAWRPRQACRYAVFYIRSREYAAPFEATVDLEGESVRVAFGLATDNLRRARRAGLAAALAAVCGIAVALGIVTALQAQSRATQAVEGLGRTLEAKTRLARAIQRQRAQGRELRTAVGQAGRIEDVLVDLAWASSAKSPDARINAVHWDHGLLAVETHGEAAPFTASDRQIEKSSQPLRPGTWLWGVRPPLISSGLSGAMARP